MPAKKAETKEVKATASKKTVAKKEVVEKKVAPKKAAIKKEVVVETKPEVVVEEKVEVVSEKPVVALGVSASVEQLFEAGAHFGHVAKKWNPKMATYLWGEKNGIHIFDLEQTVAHLEEAAKYLADAAATGKRIAIVGTKRQARPLVEALAKKAGIPFMTQRWLGGLMTNWRQIKLSIDRLTSLKTKRDSGQLKKFTKKEQVLFDKEIAKLERVVGGLVNLKDIPEVLIVVDTHNEKLAVKEAKLKHATVIGLVDSNANPDVIDYVIPVNDDSTKALELVLGVLEDALVNGYKDSKKK